MMNYESASDFEIAKTLIITCCLLITACEYPEGSIYLKKQEWFCADKGGVHTYDKQDDLSVGFCNNGRAFNWEDYSKLVKNESTGASQ